jgi:hypothetical protein
VLQHEQATTQVKKKCSTIQCCPNRLTQRVRTHESAKPDNFRSSVVNSEKCHLQNVAGFIYKLEALRNTCGRRHEMQFGSEWKFKCIPSLQSKSISKKEESVSKRIVNDCTVLVFLNTATIGCDNTVRQEKLMINFVELTFRKTLHLAISLDDSYVSKNEGKNLAVTNADRAAFKVLKIICTFEHLI